MPNDDQRERRVVAGEVGTVRGEPIPTAEHCRGVACRDASVAISREPIASFDARLRAYRD